MKWRIRKMYVPRYDRDLYIPEYKGRIFWKSFEYDTYCNTIKDTHNMCNKFELVRASGSIMKERGYWYLTLYARTNFVPPADVDIEPVIRARIYSIDEMKRLIIEFAETMSSKGVKPKSGAAWGALV